MSKYAEHWDTWRRMYFEDEVPLKEIARRFDCSPTAVRNQLIKDDRYQPGGYQERGQFKTQGPWEDRFWNRVEKRPDGIWEWTGNRDRTGHGTFSVEGKSMGAHRASWILHNGPIPAGKHVCHTNDVPFDVNPDHLYLGDPVDNVRDAVNRGGMAQHWDPDGNSGGPHPYHDAT